MGWTRRPRRACGARRARVGSRRRREPPFFFFDVLESLSVSKDVTSTARPVRLARRLARARATRARLNINTLLRERGYSQRVRGCGPARCLRQANVKNKNARDARDARAKR